MVTLRLRFFDAKPLLNNPKSASSIFPIDRLTFPAAALLPLEGSNTVLQLLRNIPNPAEQSIVRLNSVLYSTKGSKLGLFLSVLFSNPIS